MVLPFFSLCGAIPFDPVMAYDPAVHGVNNRVLVCCHCHVMESLALLDERNPSEDTYPFQSHPVDSLPDVVPRPSDKLANRVSLTNDEEEPDSPSVKDIQQFRMPDEEKSAAASWKQVGQELRRIADQFETSRRPAADTYSTRRNCTSSSAASSWIQTCILHGLVAYAGWRIQRWISG